jgi:hypothetical protein
MYPSSAVVVVLFRLFLRRVIDPGISGWGGAEPYMYDWIIIVMSNKRVPPDPSRYLDFSYLSFVYEEMRTYGKASNR